ncbi:MAG TPA: hypothetical protein VK624_01270 [Steroidobacteraceae bacterium]|nr:hypothetical protein [Steroidobacteraceae bacterium]
MISGNRAVFIALLGAGALFATNDARAPVAPREWGIANEFDCSADLQRVELRFERITTDPDPEEMRAFMSRGSQRAVVFEWNPATSELSFSVRAEFTHPAAHGPAPSRLTTAGCESR